MDADNLSDLLALAIAALYFAGLTRMWSHAGLGRGISIGHAAAGIGGWLVLGAAIMSPLHELSEQLLSVHMIEHELLMAVAAPLLALARPIAAVAWALPRAMISTLAVGTSRLGLASLRRFLSDPLVCTILHGIAIWGWHAPTAFDAALANDWLHLLQHVSFLLSGLLFWSALMRTDRYGAAIGHLFATSMHMGLLGALMALSTSAWYAFDADAVRVAGMTLLQDQQLAGLIMWVPAGIIYVGAALAFARLWITNSSQGASSSATAHG